MENVNLEVRETDGRITLRGILSRYVVRLGGEWKWFGIVSIGVVEPSGFHTVVLLMTMMIIIMSVGVRLCLGTVDTIGPICHPTTL
jgi:hypothetical protein